MRSLAFIIAVVAAYLLLRGQPAQLPVLLRTCVAVLVLVAGLGFWGRRSRPEGAHAVPRRTTGWLDYLAIGASVLALECGFVLFLSAAPPPLESAAARIESWWRAGTPREHDTAESGGANPPGNWLWPDYERRVLPRRTDLKPGNRPEVFLRPADSATAGKLLASRIYVQAFALASYDAGTWETRPGPRETLSAGPDGWLRLGDRRTGQNLDCEVFHAADRPSGNPLTALQGVIAVETPELIRLGEGLHVLPPPGGDGYQYRAVSKPLALDDLPKGSRAVAATATDDLLEIPPGPLGSRITALAELAAGEGATVERLLRLRGHLRTTLGYSLRTGNPRDLDPIENFLFAEQKGHCEFFATAGALLARSLGVPARVSYGWAGGTYYEGSNLFVFRSREAHAWTEVLLEGHGWTVLDATPPGALERELAGLAAPDEPPPGTDELVSTDEPGALLAGADGGLRAPLLLVAGVAVPALLLLAWRARRVAVQPADGTADPFDSDEAGYLAAFRRATSRHGRSMAGARTLRRHLLEMADPPPFARELRDYHYAVRYEGKPGDPRLERRLKKAADEWR